MKVLLCKEYGVPDTLILQEVASLTATVGKVVIAIKACSINFPDTLIIQNRYQFKPALPFSPGGEVAGIIKEVGEGVKHLKVGDRVLALPGWGGLAEELLIDARRVFPMLPEMDFVTASSVMYNYGTSYHALKDRAELKSGETLLVLGAAGGVGLAAVELGKLMGATVIAAASTNEKLAICTEKGADFVINYANEDIKEKIKTITGGKGIDVVYDAVGDKYAEPAIRSMAWRGRYLVVGFAAGEIPKIPLNLALLKGCAIVGVFWGQFVEKEPQKSMKNVQELLAHFVKGNLRPHFHKIYPLEKATTALNDLMNRKVVGKAVVVMSKDVKKPTFKAPKPEKILKVKQQGNTLIFKNLAQLKQYEGKEIGVSTWQTITQADINTFGKVTDDEQWIHIDEAMAKEKSPFGTTVAHGFMVLSFASKFFFELFKVESAKMGLNYGANRVRFTSPILSGCRVRMKATLKSIEDMPQSGVKLLMEVVFEMEGAQKPVCVAELLSVIYE